MVGTLSDFSLDPPLTTRKRWDFKEWFSNDPAAWIEYDIH